jgi:peptidoglycan hydrolase-like protein with peptidoglycan-binding domain
LSSFHAVQKSRAVLACCAALLAAALLALPMTASAAKRVDRPTKEQIREAQRELGVRADGVLGPRTRRAVRRYQRREGLRVDGVLGPATLRSLGVVGEEGSSAAAPETEGGTAPEGTPPGPTAEAAATLERIAECESDGDPAAVSADGVHRGKYQFDQSTWEGLGGTGDPAAAPESVQDAMAAKLLARRGTSPWPVCGG